MQAPDPEIPLLAIRQAQASLAGPLIEAYADTIGRQKAFQIAGTVIAGQAEAAGRKAARMAGGNSLGHLWQIIRRTWALDGALELELLACDEKRLYFNVTRCAYVRMYSELGLAHLGRVLSCSRDGSFAHGFNPEIRLERTGTIMEGASFCDFRFSMNHRGCNDA